MTNTPNAVSWSAKGREGYASFKVWFEGNSDCSTMDCQEGEMSLTRGRVNLPSKGSGGLDSKPQHVIQLEKSQPRPQGTELGQSECWWRDGAGSVGERDFSSGAGEKIREKVAVCDPWLLTITMSTFNANFG